MYFDSLNWMIINLNHTNQNNQWKQKQRKKFTQLQPIFEENMKFVGEERRENSKAIRK